MTRRRSFGMTAVVAGVLACSENNGLGEPFEGEVLLVNNNKDNALSIVPVDVPDAGGTVPLGFIGNGLSARADIALVPLPGEDAVAVVDLRAARAIRRIRLPVNSGATGSAMIDDSIAYVGNPNLNTISRVNYRTGARSEVAVGIHPQGLIYAAGLVFVMNGNLVGSNPPGPSWLSVVDPTTNSLARGVDSIPLTGSGSAEFATIGSDGMVYVLSTGAYRDSTTHYHTGEGYLSSVDPVARVEVASHSGFGTDVFGNLAADARGRIYITSFEGVLVFDIATTGFMRGPDNRLPVPYNLGVAVDSRGRIYGVFAGPGPCLAQEPGAAFVFDPLFNESDTIPLGSCAGEALTVQIPPP
jgi:hypothetical protein